MNYLMLIVLTIFFLFVHGRTNEIKPTNANLSKRNLEELSYSYAATDIGSKTGTRIKTITVIKNLASKKHKTLKINPELHKNEDWGTEFRDHFDKIAKIPELPDVFQRGGDSEESEMKNSDEEVVMLGQPMKMEMVGQPMQMEMQEQPMEMTKPKEIPIYEEPEAASVEAAAVPESEEPQEAMAQEAMAQEATTQEEMSNQEADAAMSGRVIQKLPKDIELVDIGPISLKQAEQSAKSQALRYKSYHPEKEGLKEYRTYPMTANVPPQRYQQNSNSEGSDTPPNYLSQPARKYTNVQIISSTTAATPYIAPNKKQFKVDIRQNQKVATTPEPYLAPSLKKMYTTVRPVTLAAQYSRSSTATINNNSYQTQRFRGVRY